jgi:Dyp-type peroxidase family
MDGSFFVFRKLRQAVGEFHSFVNSAAGQLGMSPDELGARLVGRWRDGAPIMRSDTPNQALGDDDCANNNFEFREDSEQVLSGDDGQCLDKVHPTSKADPDGKTCPFAAHIRKAYPRDDTSDSIDGVGEDSTQTHRLLRRGIPFGAASASTLDKPVIGEVDGGRGLLFMCYQTSIEDGFEFVQRMWANNPTFANELADKGGNGHDPIIGQTNENGRKRFIVIRHKGKETKLELPVDWIFTQGGGYFFSPSIAALGQLSKGFK